MSGHPRKRHSSPPSQDNQAKRRAQLSLQLNLTPVLWESQSMHEEDEHAPPKTIGHRPSNEQEDDPSQHDERRQVQELQSEPTAVQQFLETDNSGKRSQNMIKCERCRLDKKKCLPVDRVWPLKCKLCTNKGFPCSEGKRVTRSTKHTPEYSSSSANGTSPAKTSIYFEEKLKQWTFLSSYHTMMHTAKDHLEELEKYMISPFTDMDFRARSSAASSYFDFKNFLDEELKPMFRRCTQDLLTVDLSLQNLPGWFFPVSLSRNIAHFECDAVAYCPAPSRTITNGFENSQDVCGELLLLQHYAIEHWDDINRGARYRDLLLEVPKRASAIFDTYGSSKAAAYTRSKGIYNPEEYYLTLLNDCLGRVRLHFYLRYQINYEDAGYLGEDFEFEGDLSRQKDKQDILGRTALLMACQADWKEAVERLLKSKPILESRRYTEVCLCTMLP